MPVPYNPTDLEPFRSSTLKPSCAPCDDVACARLAEVLMSATQRLRVMPRMLVVATMVQKLFVLVLKMLVLLIHFAQPRYAMVFEC